MTSALWVYVRRTPYVLAVICSILWSTRTHARCGPMVLPNEACSRYHGVAGSAECIPWFFPASPYSCYTLMWDVENCVTGEIFRKPRALFGEFFSDMPYEFFALFSCGPAHYCDEFSSYTGQLISEGLVRCKEMLPRRDSVYSWCFCAETESCAEYATPERCDQCDNDFDGVIDNGAPALGWTNDPCDGIDNDCDGLIDEDPTPEVCDGKDNDCDGIVDNLADPIAGVYDRCDGIDNDCDGLIDEDPEVEICDGKDNDCDGEIDENAVPEICNDGVDNDCDGLIDNIEEICNGINDNCNDEIDEGCFEDPDPPEDECSPLMVFDPANIATGQSFLRRRDFTINTQAGTAAFERIYSPRGETPDSFRLPNGRLPLENTPTPFGRNPSGAGNMLWWHNYYSFVYEDYIETLNVFAPNGRMYRYAGCTPDVGASCWAQNQQGSEAVRHRLRVNADGGGALSYTFVMDDGRSFLYARPYVTATTNRKTYLSSVGNERGETLATLYYADSDGSTCPAAGVGGVPYLSRILFANGSEAQLNYDVLGDEGECVLVSVTVGTETVVGYSYWLNGPGLLAAVDGERSETYGYSGDSFAFTLGDQSGAHTLNEVSGRVEGISAAAGIGSVFLDYGADGSTNSTSFSIPPPYSAAPIEVTRTYSVARAEGHQSYRVGAITESCADAPDVCQQGTTSLLLGTTTSQVTYERGSRDPNGGYSIQEESPSTSPFPSLLETTAVYKGASVEDGSDALEVGHYSYSYDSVGRQQVERHYRDSLYGGVTDAQFDYDSNNRIVKVTHYGKTKALWDIVPSDRWIVTFYRYSTGTPCAPVAAGYEWKETRGPCIFDADPSTQTDCPAGSSFPVVQEVYYPNSAPAPKRGQLFKRVSFPSGCDQTATLVTTFLNYDAFGNALSIQDPNGVVTAYTWDGPAHRIRSKTIGSKVWSYEYDNGELLSIRYPEGNYEVYCHRVGGSSSGCDLGGEWSPKLQWKAKAGDAFAASFAEKVIYSYRSDGTVDTESYFAADGSIRRVKRFAANAHGNTIREGLGIPNAESRSPIEYVRQYDHAGMRSFGRPYVNHEDDTPYCDDVSNNCSKLSYDLAGRLKSVVEYPNSLSVTTQLFKYDAHGNVAGVLTGCNESDTYPICEQAGKPESLYEYDDFGNLVRISLPFLGETGGGVVRKEYNALGLVTRQDSEKLRALTTKEWLEYSYDQLGRLLTASRVEGDASGNEKDRELLYTNQYDFALSDGACSTLTNVKGRLRRTIDNFGATWFSYDAEGRVVAERRLREGGSCAGGIDDKPSTMYQYSPNGNLSQITYPHSLVVDYNYGSGGLKDRIESIDMNVNGQSSTIVTTVRWEPYGDVRDYHLLGSDMHGAVLGNVSYLPGDADHPLPSNCSVLATDPMFGNTGTGLLKSLWVTRTHNGKIWESLLKQSYRWRGDQIAETRTCLLNESVPRTHMFQYDQIDRLTSVSSGGTGLLSVRTYPLDGRGRRVSSTGPTFATEDDASFYYQYDTPTSTDRLGARRQFVGAPGNTSALGYNGRSYSWDVDGRVSEIENPPYNMFFGYSVDEQAAGRDAVFRSVSVTKGPSNGIFNYYYDSKGRRRLKVYPLNLLSDEYFYSVSNQLLEDRSMVSAFYLSGYSVDQYIWLGTRPVAMVKSRFDGSWLPSQESLCPRRGENAACGLYFIVTDHLPKPVLMLNKALQVVGTAEYDPFGYPNRQAVNSQVLSGKPNQSLLFGVCEDPGASATGVQRRVRARFSFFDVAKSKVSADGVFLKAGSTVLDSETGSNRGLVVTPWVNPGSLPLGVYYYLDNDGITGDGVALESCEFRRYEAGVTYPVWTPIRFPGQYHDEETDLFENWNRYYDPSIGRYLQPEPLLSEDPKTWLTPAHGVPSAYAYAWTNPIFFTDEDGLFSKKGQCKNSPEEKACKDMAGLVLDPKLSACIARQCDKACLNCTEEEKKKECKKKTIRDGDQFAEATTAAAADYGSLKEPGKEVVWCGKEYSSDCRTRIIVHELAHTCGWKHGQGKGVPQNDGRVDCR